jgi:hypothetical protein
VTRCGHLWSDVVICDHMWLKIQSEVNHCTKKYYKEPKFVKLCPVRTGQFSENRPDYRIFYTWLGIIREPEAKNF